MLKSGEIRNKAQSILDCIAFDDHSDVGMALCHQKVAEVFINCLIANGLVKVDSAVAKKWLEDAGSCCFFKNEKDMSDSSKRIVNLAKFVISAQSLTSIIIESFGFEQVEKISI